VVFIVVLYRYDYDVRCGVNCVIIDTIM